MMGAKLLFRDAQGRDASVDVPGDGAFLGRAADCLVRTDDAMVSRKNCKISTAGGRWFVEDLGSSNGTFVNETRVQKQQLAHADVIRCGSLQVRFVETADQPAAGGKPRTMSLEPQGGGGSVQVSPELTGGSLDPASLMAMKDQEISSTAQERDALAARLREAAQELEGLNARFETEQAELKKARTELSQIRERLNDLSRQKSLADEELHATHKVTEELRNELAAMRDEFLTAKTRAEEATEELSARDRQLERAQEDVQRAKVATDELRGKLAELQKTKDEGWRELNNRVGELDHLREVISEQERILEERRVGLISLDSTMKELRADKEKTMRDAVQMKTERDQLKDHLVKAQAQVDGLEEEHRRLARALSDAASNTSSSAASANEEHMKMATELRETKVELRKVESERSRLASDLARIQQERQDVEDKHAHADVEAGQAKEGKAAAEAARGRAEEALAKAETARQRAEEEKQAAQKARDAALVTNDELRRDNDRERKRVAELEGEIKAAKDAATRAAEAIKAAEAAKHAAEEAAKHAAEEAAAAKAEAANTGEHAAVHGGDPRKIETVRVETLGEEMTNPGETGENAEARIAQLEEELSKLATELALAQEQAAAHAAAHPAGASSNAGGTDVAEIRKRAEEAYTGINDLLSELRTNVLLAKDLATEHGPHIPDADAAKTLSEAIQISVDRTEDAKGLLRALREVIE
jgi:predicted  nucleic acid-binding Zn-ribbon protein